MRTLLAGLLIFSGCTEAQTLKTLYSFQNNGSDGFYPQFNLTLGGNANLFGTTSVGGTHGGGTVFLLSPPAAQGENWNETVLYNFAGGSGDGVGPASSVVLGSGGMLYGSTSNGGSLTCSSGCGTVFSLTPPAFAGGKWTELVLYKFQGGLGDGSYPYGGVSVGADGILYGTTETGGAMSVGTVFSLTPPSSPGGSWTEHVLYSFGEKTVGDGADPVGGVVIGKGGVLYGTTEAGGSEANCGTVFEVSPPATKGSSWAEAVLYSFAASNNPSDGCDPLFGRLAIGEGGVLYGTTGKGGGLGQGTVFSLTPPSSSGLPWTELTYGLTIGAASPYGGVAASKNGDLYGTTQYGGKSGSGTVFAVAPPSSAGATWTETVLGSFTDSNGTFPWASVVIGSGGVLYGATEEGGTGACVDGAGNKGCGTVFALVP